MHDYWGRVRGGDLGSMPAVLGLIVLSLIFGIARPTFFGPLNFANLFTQGAQVVFIAMGLIFVLLLGEIDLSAGFASGVCGAVMAILLTNHGVAWFLAIPAALLTGVVIGLALGLLIAKVGIPSFVVTLAAFLGFQGLLLVLLGGGINISIRDEFVIALNNNNIPVLWSWIIAFGVVAGYAVVQLARIRGRAARGLVTDPLGIVALRVGGLAVLVLATTAVLTQERAVNPAINSLKGVPIIVPIIAAFLIFWTFVLGRTTYGRHVYAVGGNTEAARRAGIPVDRIRISVFAIGSFMAAVGGIMAVSRASSVDPNTGGSNILLYSVGAAVIGGTSLFGGKGKVINAVIGGAVIAVIDNGMGLMGFSSGQKYIFTGLILLVAASVDALARRRAAATGPDGGPRRGAHCPVPSRSHPRTRPGAGALMRAGPSPEEIRRHNLGSLLRYVHLHGATSRAELTSRLGLNRSTIGALTAELATAGLVTEAAPREKGRAGRPSLVVRPESARVHAYALSVEADRLRAARVGLGGTILDHREITRPRGLTLLDAAGPLASLIADMRGGVADDARYVGTGLAITGLARLTSAAPTRSLASRPAARPVGDSPAHDRSDRVRGGAR